MITLISITFFALVAFVVWHFLRQCKIDDFKRHLRQMDGVTLQRYINCDELNDLAKKLVRAEYRRRWKQIFT